MFFQENTLIYMYNVYKSVFYFKRGIFMLKDGTYDGEARGMAGFVKAKLTIKDKKLLP